MSAAMTEPAPVARRPSRFSRTSAEFTRVLNLSDAVFAIALTLLVLNLEVPRVPAGELAGALADQTSSFVAFALAFFLVASTWWQHHRAFAVLAGGSTIASLSMAHLGPGERKSWF